MTTLSPRLRSAFIVLLAAAMLGLGSAACSLHEGKMPQTYPNDADGEALRRVAEDGSDMSKPMLIDFHIAAPDEDSANAIAQAAAKVGYQTSVYRYESDGPWTSQCSKEMLATYDGVIAVQAELDALSRPLGGHSDGWGTFGNVDTP